LHHKRENKIRLHSEVVAEMDEFVHREEEM